MPPRGRHRRPPPPQPGAAPADGGSQITGKRASQAKNERYAKPLPLQFSAPRGKQKQKELSWSQWLSSWFGGPTQEGGGDEILVGYWDEMTSSVWVQVTPAHVEAGPSKSGDLESDARLAAQTKTCRDLWDSGFFGKGSLSRSEPTWRTRKLNEERVKLQRLRGMKVFTPEELTASRRRERMHAKIERARLAVKAGQQLPDGIVALGGTLTEEEEKIIAKRAAEELDDEEASGAKGVQEEEYGKHIPGLIYLGPKKDDGAGLQLQFTEEEIRKMEEEERNVKVTDMEWLHLSRHEAFFLAGMLGVLEVRDQEDRVIPLRDLYTSCLASHLAPPLRSLQLQRPGGLDQYCRPDNPFLLSYIAYHHYRSLGWAVKSGIKFCADWLLYKRGPVFGHAEFAILIVPVYEDPADEASSPFPRHPAAGDRDWVWFSTMNRVQTQVLKTLVLTHVTIPAISRTPPSALKTPEALVEGLKSGRLHSIREVSLRRWVPARNRA